MSEQTTSLNNGQQAIVQTDVSKIFVWDNRYENGDVNNSGYVDLVLKAGTVMGRVTATDRLKSLESDAVDGSEVPVGILNKDHTIAAGVTQQVAICVAGDVVEGKLVFTKVGDTLETIINSRRLKDSIGAETVGVKLVDSTEITGADNE